MYLHAESPLSMDYKSPVDFVLSCRSCTFTVLGPVGVQVFHKLFFNLQKNEFQGVHIIQLLLEKLVGEGGCIYRDSTCHLFICLLTFLVEGCCGQGFGIEMSVGMILEFGTLRSECVLNASEGVSARNGIE